MEKKSDISIGYSNGVPSYVELDGVARTPDFILSVNTGFDHAFVFVEKKGGVEKVVIADSQGKRVKGVYESGELNVGEDVAEQSVLPIIDKVEKYVSGFSKYAATSSSEKAVLCFDSKRVGDYFSQLNWLSSHLADYGDSFLRDSFSKILYRPEGNFLLPYELFPEVKDMFFPCCDVYEEAWRNKVSRVYFMNKMLSSRRDNYSSLSGRMYDVYGECLVENSTRAKLIVSLDVEKRRWVNQAECLEYAVRHVLGELGSGVDVIVNGMTGFVSGGGSIEKIKEKERQVFSDTFKNIDVNVVDCSGMLLSDKFKYFHGASFFIAPIGSATMLPSLIMGIDGMVVGNSEMAGSSWYKSFARKSCWFPDIEKVEDVLEVKGEIDWKKQKEALSYIIDMDYFSQEFRKFFGESSCEIT